MSVMNENMKHERWISTLSAIFSQNNCAPFWSQPVRDTETVQQFPQHRKKKRKKPPLRTIKTRALCSTEGRGEPETSRAQQACAKDTAIPVTWWADGWSHDYMHTKSYKSQVQHSFFKWHALGLCVDPTIARWALVFRRPTGVFISLLRSSFGACREQQGRGQFTVSPVTMARKLQGRLQLTGSLWKWNPFIRWIIYCFVFSGERHSSE